MKQIKFALFVSLATAIAVLSYIQGIRSVQVPADGQLVTQAEVSRFASDTSIMEGVNEYRKSQGLSPLELDNSLNQSAQIRADEIAATNTWSHARPDGQAPWTTIANWQSKYRSVGENLAKCQSSSKEAVEGWIKSQTHEENIVGDWDVMGVAVAYDPSQKCVIYVNHFGRN